ncbi:heme-binding protein [Lichenibacterium dinghuense]|uniref:heme-binding protein n=1 Tax=Lichenibacterium dinghuense TaxID=2895977 RepID=UPI001F2C42C7|nr:heme-binding protein [Lichenibacterium sp. 6Y81]
MRSRPELQAADVRALMAAARAEAEARGLAVTVAVVDAAGVPLALERLDGARLHTPEAAILKARTAAVVRTPTADLQTAVAGDPALLAFPDRLPLAGGVPLVHGGEVVGGVGSSGGEPEDDLRVCAAAVAALAKLAG